MKNSKLILIVALGQQNQIGLDGTMPWHLRDDLQNFKKITSGHTLIMGRKTFESIGKALPNRLNFVISSQPEKVTAKEICVYDDLDKAIKKAKKFDKKVFIIGGASIYKQTLNQADELLITHVDYNGKADTYFPEIDFSKWKVDAQNKYLKNKHNDYDFEIVRYSRK